MKSRRVYLKSGLVCMNFIRFAKKEFEMYATSMGWRHPASMSVNWPPCSRMDAGENLPVAVEDGLKDGCTYLLVKKDLCYVHRTG